MTRYDFDEVGPAMAEHPEGEWVRWEDVETLLADLRIEAESVNGTYRHPDHLEQAVCQAFDRIRAHLAKQVKP